MRHENQEIILVVAEVAQQLRASTFLTKDLSSDPSIYNEELTTTPKSSFRWGCGIRQLWPPWVPALTDTYCTFPHTYIQLKIKIKNHPDWMLLART